MKSLIYASILSLAAAIAATPATAERYGAGVEIDKATPIARILADPDSYLGKTVRIEGTVLDVCPKKGCWIELAEDGESLRVKVEDDVIVFPADAKGRPVAAQGKVEAIEMSREAYLDYLAHLAEEQGDSFDRESADVGDGPYRIIRIQGTGAEIGDGSGSSSQSEELGRWKRR